MWAWVSACFMKVYLREMAPRWNALIRVHELHQSKGIRLGGVSSRLFLNALASCIRKLGHNQCAIFARFCE